MWRCSHYQNPRLWLMQMVLKPFYQFGPFIGLGLCQCEHSIIRVFKTTILDDRFRRPRRQTDTHTHTHTEPYNLQIFFRFLQFSLPFCSQGGGVCLSACWDTTPRSRTPGTRHPLGSRHTHTPDQTPPGADTPQGADTLPEPDTPPGTRHPPPTADTYWNAFLLGKFFTYPSCPCLSGTRRLLLNWNLQAKLYGMILWSRKPWFLFPVRFFMVKQRVYNKKSLFVETQLYYSEDIELDLETIVGL